MPSVRSETPSRLKGIETPSAVSTPMMYSASSETPSRLKGIETSFLFLLLKVFYKFGNTFPFEGN